MYRSDIQPAMESQLSALLSLGAVEFPAAVPAFDVLTTEIPRYGKSTYEFGDLAVFFMYDGKEEFNTLQMKQLQTVLQLENTPVVYGGDSFYIAFTEADIRRLFTGELRDFCLEAFSDEYGSWGFGDF